MYDFELKASPTRAGALFVAGLLVAWVLSLVVAFALG